MITVKAVNYFVYIKMAVTDQKHPSQNPVVLFLGYENSHTFKPAAMLPPPDKK